MTNSTTIQMPEVTFQSTSPYINSNMVSSGTTYAPASYGPRRSAMDDDDWLDWGDGDGESGGTTIGEANGMHGGESLPVGDAIYPLILCLIAYFAIKRRFIAKLM